MDDLAFHWAFEDHQASADRHVVTIAEVLEAWEARHVVVPNRKGRRGQLLLVGSTRAGRRITVVLIECRPVHVVVAYTAWDTKGPDERQTGMRSTEGWQ